MRVMVILKSTPETEAGLLPDQEFLSAMARYHEDLVHAGVLLAGEQLHPSTQAKRVQFLGPRQTVSNGPFSDSRDLISAYWLWKVDSMDEALEWALKCPHSSRVNSELEIRPIFEAQDLHVDFTAQLAAQEARLNAPRAEMLALSSKSWAR